MMKYGDLELYINELNIGSLLFGTKRTKKTLS